MSSNQYKASTDFHNDKSTAVELLPTTSDCQASSIITPRLFFDAARHSATVLGNFGRL